MQYEALAENTLLGESQSPNIKPVCINEKIIIAFINCSKFYKYHLCMTYLELYISWNPHFFNFAPKIIRTLQNVSKDAPFEWETYTEQRQLKISL